MLQKMLKNSTVSSTTALSRAQDAIVKGHGSLPPAQLLRQLLVRVVESGLHNTPYGPKDTYDVSTRVQNGDYPGDAQEKDC